MTLLFYSHEYQLDKVPYTHFIQAYGEQNNSECQDQYTEEEKTQIVKNYLTEIASAMKKIKVSVREVFQIDQGLIYPESFIAGLEYLGLKNIEHEVIVLILEALQYEEENEACILMEEFEKIMENFGAPPSKTSENRSKTSNSNKYSSENSDAEIKKFSAVDSENYEYSDDSPEKHGISEISPFGSVSKTGINKQQSYPVLKTANKQELDKVSSENSIEDSKKTPTISKIEVNYDRKDSKNKESSSDSLRDILKQADNHEISSSFGSRKKNQPTNFNEMKEKQKIPANKSPSSDKRKNMPPKSSGSGNNSKVKEYYDEKFDSEESKSSENKKKQTTEIIPSIFNDKQPKIVADNDPYGPLKDPDYLSSSIESSENEGDSDIKGDQLEQDIEEIVDEYNSSFSNDKEEKKNNINQSSSSMNKSKKFNEVNKNIKANKSNSSNNESSENSQKTLPKFNPPEEIPLPKPLSNDNSLNNSLPKIEKTQKHSSKNSDSDDSKFESQEYEKSLSEFENKSNKELIIESNDRNISAKIEEPEKLQKIESENNMKDYSDNFSSNSEGLNRSVSVKSSVKSSKKSTIKNPEIPIVFKEDSDRNSINYGIESSRSSEKLIEDEYKSSFSSKKSSSMSTNKPKGLNNEINPFPDTQSNDISPNISIPNTLNQEPLVKNVSVTKNSAISEGEKYSSEKISQNSINESIEKPDEGYESSSNNSGMF